MPCAKCKELEEEHMFLKCKLRDVRLERKTYRAALEEIRERADKAEDNLLWANIIKGIVERAVDNK